MVLLAVGDEGANRTWKVTLSELQQLRQGEPLEPLLDGLIAYRTVNHQTIKGRTRFFVDACCLLPLQILLWAPALKD